MNEEVFEIKNINENLKNTFFLFEPVLKEKLFGKPNLKEFTVSKNSKVYSTDKEYILKTIFFKNKYYLYYLKPKHFEEKVITLKHSKGMFSRTIKDAKLKKENIIRIEELLSKPLFFEEGSNNNKLVWIYNSKRIE